MALHCIYAIRTCGFKHKIRYLFAVRIQPASFSSCQDNSADAEKRHNLPTCIAGISRLRAILCRVLG